MKPCASVVRGGFLIKKLGLSVRFKKEYEPAERVKRDAAKRGYNASCVRVVRLDSRSRVTVVSNGRRRSMSVDSLAHNFRLDPISPDIETMAHRRSVSGKTDVREAVAKILALVQSMHDDWFPKQKGNVVPIDPRQLTIQGSE